MTGENSCESNQGLLRSMDRCSPDSPSAYQHAVEDVQPQTKEGEITRNMASDPTIEEVDWSTPDYSDVTATQTNGKDNEPLWAGLCSMRNVYQLGGELDIEQIERN